MTNEKKCVYTDQSSNLEQCESVSVVPTLTPAGPTIIRVPVTLAERRVSTNLVAKIHFPDPVLEIKDIKKRVEVVQCRLLLSPPTTMNPFESVTQRLFIKGYVRKNIQYATPCPGHDDCCVSSEMRSLTCDIPFECVTIIPAGEFLSPPQLPLPNIRTEFDFFRAQELGHGFPEKDQFLSSDLSQFHQVSSQFYNQLPYCELISSHIVEWDEAIDRKPLHGNAPFEEGTFRNIVEKMFLEFTVKVLQNQQVRVTALPLPLAGLVEDKCK